MKLVHISLFHGRPDVSAIFLDHMRGRHVAACVTEGDEANISLLRAAGVPFIEYPNKPLGAKCNAALAFALTMDPDACIIHPSDDFIAQEWIDAALGLIRDGANYVCPARCGMHEPWTGRSCTLNQTAGVLGCGSGRIFSREVLEVVQPMWTPQKPRGLDHNSHMHVTSGAGYVAHYLKWTRVPVVDVKSSVNIWPFDHWVKKGTHATADDVLWMLSPEQRAAVAGIKESK